MTTFTLHRSWKSPFPKLPFQPEGVGVNCFKQGYKESLLPIDCVEICWVNKGSCLIEVQKMQHHLFPGQAIFKYKGEVRKKFIVDGPAEIWWATFDGEGAENFVKSFGYPSGILDAGPCPVELFQRIANGLICNKPESPRLLFPLYTELIVRGGGGFAGHTPGGKLFDKVLYRLNTNYSSPDFNINLLADEFGIHRTTLGRIMQRELGEKPLALLNRIRLERAEELLKTTLQPVADIAHACGFRECNYFCRMFRKKYGVSPSKYRQDKSN